MKAADYRKTPEWEESFEEFRDDPILFARVMFEKLATLPTPDFHHELAELYNDNSLDRLNVIAPRNHAKTTIVAQVFVLHHLVYHGHDPFVVLVSKTQTHAKRILRGIKKMIQEPKFQTMFGHILVGYDKKTCDKFNDQQIIFASGQAIYATGTGQQVRGIREGYVRPSLFVLDDPEDKENTKTAERMEANFRYLTEELIPARRKDGRIFVIGTPLHQRSMVMRLKHRPDFKSKHYSAEKDPENEISLWPEQMSWEDLMMEKRAAKADNELSSYYQEYCCKIIPDEKRLFKEEFIKYYEGEVEHKGKDSFLKYRSVDRYGEPTSEWKKTNVNIYSGIDPATSTSDTADYFVIFHVAVTPNNDRYILPYFRDRVTPSHAIEQVVAEYKKWKPVRMSIETSGQQEIMRDVLRNRDDIYIPGLSIKHSPREKKEKRHLEMLEPWFSQKKVHMMRDQKDLLSEMQMHPKGKTDDLLDGMYYSFQHARPPKSIKSKEERYEQELLEEARRGRQGSQHWMLS